MSTAITIMVLVGLIGLLFLIGIFEDAGEERDDRRTTKHDDEFSDHG